MQEMRDEAKAEEQQIMQERDQSEARLEPVSVLKRQVQDLISTLPPTVTLGPQETVREALKIMRDQGLSCVLVVEQGQLAGIFTERDVLTTVASSSHDLDRVPLQDVMQPAPDCLGLDDTLMEALHQMVIGGFRHVPVVDQQGQPTALVSMQAIVETLTSAFPQEILNRPPTPEQSDATAPTREGA